MTRAVFFDRDDTLVYDVPYNGDPSKVKLLPNVIKALSLLKSHSFQLFIITNQSGVGRGFISKNQVKLVNDRVLELITEPLISKVYCCYDDPKNPVENCRKPLPGMIYKASEEYNINLEHSFVVGDKLADIQAGQNAGCKSILKIIDYKNVDQTKAIHLAEFHSNDLLKISEWIINHLK